MSILALNKVTFVGHVADKDQVLTDLQELGCLQLIPMTAEGDKAAGAGRRPEALEALEFMLSCPRRRRQARRPAGFDALAVQEEALDTKRRLNDLRDERDFLVKRIADLKPWGDFLLPSVEEMGGQRLWFYTVPHNRMKDVAATDLRWEVVHAGAGSRYVVVVSPGKPEGMPVPRTHTGAKPRSELEARLDQVEMDVEDLQDQRAGLTRWCLMMADSLDALEDRAARVNAAAQTCDSDPVFGLHAWAPRERMGDLGAYALAHGLAFVSSEPEAGDDPPTLLRNPPKIAGGEDLVTFYTTPGYRCWDPSSVIFMSFALFFGMIVADVGYGAVLGLIVLCLWRRMGRSPGGRRFRWVLASLPTATIIYGAMIGSYFGLAPGPDSPLATLQVLDLADAPKMMLISVVIGVLHVVLANLMDARRRGRRQTALPPLGWAGIVAGGLVLALGAQADSGTLKVAGATMVGGGALLVAVFTGAGEKPLPRAVKGAIALTGLTTAFGDVLSYMRLFALGLASASLATAFNGMAGQIREGVPGIGLLFAVLILLVGHTMNFILSVMSGFIHGLRLNVIEFLNWGVKEEGKLYKPFERKETGRWNLSF